MYLSFKTTLNSTSPTFQRSHFSRPHKFPFTNFPAEMRRTRNKRIERKEKKPAREIKKKNRNEGLLLGFPGTMPSVPVGLSYHEMFAVSLGSPALWRCRACGKQVTNRWHHFHIHTAQRSLCPYCPATYSRIDTLRSHIRTKHREIVFAKESFVKGSFAKGPL